MVTLKKSQIQQFISHSTIFPSRAPQENQRRFSELQQEGRDRERLLVGLNDDVRLGLSKLESRVDELTSAKATAVDEKKETSPGTAIDEELRALKKKVGIIAANVLGEVEGDSWNVAAGAEKEQGGSTHSNGGDCDLDEKADDGDKNYQTGGRKNNKPAEEKEEEKEQQAQGGCGSSSNARILPPRVKARINWTKVRTHRAFLVKKIRRQVHTAAHTRRMVQTRRSRSAHKQAIDF